MWQNGTLPTTQIGYINVNRQKNLGHRGKADTDQFTEGFDDCYPFIRDLGFA